MKTGRLPSNLPTSEGYPHQHSPALPRRCLSLSHRDLDIHIVSHCSRQYIFAMSSSICRERSPIAVLLNPKKDIPIGERDIRLEDYLNDKIQTATDFDNLATLIANVENQQRQLNEQVSILYLQIANPRTKLTVCSSCKMPDPNSRRTKSPLPIDPPRYSGTPKNLRSSSRMSIGV
jgi:hypothetical protein